MVALSLTVAGCSGQAIPGTPVPPSAPPVVVAVAPDGGQPINPTTPITVTATAGTLSEVTVTNAATGRQVPGTLSADRTSWRSSQPLEYATSYRVAAKAKNAIGRSTEKDATVTTLTPAKRAYANVVPGPNVVQATGIGVGQPMVFQFTAPVANKAEVVKHLEATTDPPQPGAWYWVDDRNVHYRAQSYWQPGTTIRITAHVFGLDMGNGVYGAEDNTATYKVHDAWIAKADGRTEQLQIFDNGQMVKAMPMSLGAPGFPTHEGPHVISDKQPSIIMDSCSYGVCPGQPGYYREKVDLDLRISNDGEFVHSAPWSVGQQGNSNVSHGCVNLSPDNAQWFFDHFGIGDVVEITNSGGQPLPVWDTYGDWEVPWDQWQAGVGQAK
ncbi:L,D-transpeptidase [Gandjariella thermophila]|uniref:L,D-transpeptidase n=1 Tax=Gandjariella thermophila TaxID=1931992 RepID=UPI001CEF90D4|nr:Ig-like domain-containing protein [Gandjariella thermophila]